MKPVAKLFVYLTALAAFSPMALATLNQAALIVA